MKYEIFHNFFPASSPRENVEMTCIIPNPTNQDTVKSLGKIATDRGGKNLTSEISESSNEIASDNGATNMCPETVEEIEREAKSDIEKKNLVFCQTNNDFDNEGEL